MTSINFSMLSMILTLSAALENFNVAQATLQIFRNFKLELDFCISRGQGNESKLGAKITIVVGGGGNCGWHKTKHSW